jgi:hypothetical protein
MTIDRVLAAFALVALTGCAGTKQAFEGTRPDSEIAVIESVGDVGFRIDRTIHNMKPSAYVEKVNGLRVGDDNWGFPTVTKALPGLTGLDIYCSLPYGSADPSAPVERRGVGMYGTVSTFARIPLDIELKAGKRYELKCATVPGYRARAWLDEAN